MFEGGITCPNTHQGRPSTCSRSPTAIPGLRRADKEAQNLTEAEKNKCSEFVLKMLSKN